MTEKFQNKYRIASARLKNWDYRSDGAYFITLCTRNRECFFGKIVHSQFFGNPIGLLAEKYWLEIPQHFPFIELGNFVVMPNHIHGILIVDKSKIGNDIVCVDTDVKPGVGTDVKPGVGTDVETLHCNVSTTAATAATAANATAATATTNTPQNEQMAKISPKSGAVSTIIRSYKSVVSKHAHLILPDFDWQTRFYDHIIRDSASFERIQNYIENNPVNWDKDKFHH